MPFHLPTGTVTFLFTDIEGSTQLLQALREDYPHVLAEHHRLLRAAFDAHNGVVVDTQGDSFFVAFARATDATHSAVEGQRALAVHLWTAGAQVRVRMGLHTGEPIIAGDRYVGIDVHRAARIGAAGYGGQVLVSQTTRDLVESDLPDGVTLRDLGEHRLKDLRTAKHLYQLSIAGLRCEFPPLRTLDVARNNLPILLTSFVGREKEIREIKETLGNARLVTLTGAGGSGKTRLSLEVAAEILDLQQFENGLWFVELAPLSDPALLPQTVATTLGVREEPGRPVFNSLMDDLRDKKLLLILDNCEHLIEACAKLAEQLLRACPHLKILASSREALGIAGEIPYRVPSLSLPDPLHLSALTLANYEAARLFIDRAMTLQPTFAVNNQNAAAVAEICSRLDGIPLALELAASRVKVLSVDQISQKLDDRFRLLTGGSRAALPRQQTLRAAIDWSYDLLSEPERALLRRLAVFVGGWTLEAAEDICQGETIRLDDVLDLLTHLVDKSLVLVDEEKGEARYRMLEMIRQYAAEKLTESGEATLVWKRDLEYFCRLTERAEPELGGANPMDWLDRLELELDNLRAVLERSQTVEGGAELGLRTTGALWWFWEQRGYFAEGRERLAAALTRAGEFKQSSPYAKALATAAHLAYRQGDHTAARALAEESLTIYRQIEDKRGIAFVLSALGRITWDLGDYETGLGLFEESLALSIEVDDKKWAAFVLGDLAYAALRPGDYETAKSRLSQVLALSQETGDKYMTGFALSGLGEVAVRQGDYAGATRLLEDSLELREHIGDKRGIGVSLGTLGLLAMRQGDWIKATSQLGASLEARKEIGDKGGIAWCLEKFAEIAEARGRFAHAVRVFGAAASLRASIGSFIDPVDQPEYERRLTSLRVGLGEGPFAAELAEGRALTLQQAIALALSENESPENES